MTTSAVSTSAPSPLPGVPTKSRWRGADFVGWVAGEGVRLPLQEPAPGLEDDLERGEAGHARLVERRRDLTDVEADGPAETRRRLEQAERLSGAEPAGGRHLGAGRERGVQHVDVERHVEPPALERPG